MRLTRKKAIELCIELWTWLAETGKMKKDWPEWGKYGDVHFDCFFCEYDSRFDDDCTRCPYYNTFGHCEMPMNKPFLLWFNSKTEEDCKKYAKLFLEQIKTLR